MGGVFVFDDTRPFHSQEFSEYLSSMEAKHLFSLPYLPRANGQAEETVQQVKWALKKSVRDRSFEILSLQRRINKFIVAYRTTPHTLTNKQTLPQ
jgi:hypothetical protein